MNKGVIAVFIFPFLLSTAFAQQVSVMENNSPRIKWYKIQTPHFKILFPKGFEEQGARLANTLEHIREPEGRSIGAMPRRMTILLQNQSSVSNGFVTFAPKRSEFFTMPAQNYNFIGTNDWLNILATHEYRHMAQFQKSITGFNKVIYYAFGQQAQAAMSFITVPQWFWEGDAVATETAFTNSGRGRIPHFNMVLRANFLEGRTFNYNKQYLRSYKNFIPDHYVLGYHMVSYLRKRKQDGNVWNSITKRAWTVPFIPFAFSNSIKRNSGLNVRHLYTEMAANLKKEWQAQVDSLTITNFEVITARENETYTDFLYPQALIDGSVVAVKSGIGEISQLVLLKDGKERKGFVMGPVNESGMLSSAGEKVVWTEYRYDPRWGVHTYSVIKGYNFTDRKNVDVTRKSRLAGAAISPDGKMVAAVETDEHYKTKLMVFDYNSGSMVKIFENPANNFISMPRWSDDGRFIVALVNSKVGKSVIRFDFDRGSTEELVSAGDENIGYPVLFRNYLFYNSPYSGIDNIYAFDIDSKKKYQVTCSKYGAFNPSVSPDGSTIYYNNQGRNGMDVVKIPFDPTKWKAIEIVGRPASNNYVHLVEQEGHSDLLENTPSIAYPVSRYRSVTGIINPHSWGLYADNTFTRAELGITSRDVLSTMQINGGYVFDIQERTGEWRAGLSYQGWYPIIDVNFISAKRSVNEGSAQFLAIDTFQIAPLQLDSSLFEQNVRFKWSEKTAEAGLRIPLNTTRSKYFSRITFSNHIGITQVTDFSNSINQDRTIPAVYRDGPSSTLSPSPSDNITYFFRDYVGEGALIYNHFGLQASRLLKRSKRDINSRWGQAFFVDFYNTPYQGDFSGRQLSLLGYLYLPGIGKHHSLWGYWAYQNTYMPSYSLVGSKNLDNYLFRNKVPAPRGVSVYRHEVFYSMAANYALPVWYPDIALGPLVNFQRIRLNGFADYAFGTNPNAANPFQESYLSAGAELKADVNLIRFLPQIDFGLRYSYVLTSPFQRGSMFEFLIGTFNF